MHPGAEGPDRQGRGPRQPFPRAAGSCQCAARSCRRQFSLVVALGGGVCTDMAVKEGYERSPPPGGPQAPGALVHWGGVKPDGPVTDKLEALQPHKGRQPLLSSRL